MNPKLTLDSACAASLRLCASAFKIRVYPRPSVVKNFVICELTPSTRYENF